MTYINAAHGNDQMRDSILLYVESQPAAIFDARVISIAPTIDPYNKNVLRNTSAFGVPLPHLL